MRRWHLLAVYPLLAAIAAVQQWSLQRPGDLYTHYNNYVIFRQSFFHLINNQDLYAAHLTEHWDYFRYSPSFALAFGVFAWMPDVAGLLVWNLLNAAVLLVAWTTFPARDHRVAVASGWFVAIEMMTALQNAQSNVLIAGLLILAFNCLERRMTALAALAIAVASFIKPFGLAAFSLWLLYPEKKRFALFALLWCGAIAVIPLSVIQPDQLIRLYGSWWNLVLTDYSATGLSFMAWLQSWFALRPPNVVVLVIAMGMFATPFLFVDRYRQFIFRLLVLSAILIWVVIFNHKAESSSYIIAMSGAALWFFSQEQTRLNLALIVLAFVFTSLSPTDVFPRRWSAGFFDPYAIKALPCILIWGKITFELVAGKYRAKNELAN